MMSRKLLLETLAKIQNEADSNCKGAYMWPRGCSPILVSIGDVASNGTVNGDIVIKSCPPIVIDKLKELGYSLDLTERGLIVNHYGTPQSLKEEA